MRNYEELTQISKQFLETLPVEIPSTGYLAGFTTTDLDRELAQSFQSGDNLHFPLGDTYLTRGVLGVAKEARKKLASASPGARSLYMGIASVYEAISSYYGKYVVLLDEMLLACRDAFERDRLALIRYNMQTLKEGKPQTFLQGLQAVYLMWKLRCNIAWSCIGRLDVALRPLFEADIEKGILTEEQASEFLCELWNKLSDCGSGDTLINVMVGGKNADGSDASSRLSVLMLEATLKVRRTEPHINVRYHKGIREDVMAAAYRVQNLGHGQATVYNDEVIIPSLIRAGVPEAWAYCYTNDGCTEIMIEGGSMIDFAHVDAVATVELMLHNGHLFDRTPQVEVHYWTHKSAPEVYRPDVIEGHESGSADTWMCYEDVYRAFLDQYRFQVWEKCKILKEMYETRMKTNGSLLLNGTYEDVLSSGKDVMKGGLPVECYQLFSGSVPTAADCLAAIKQVVFEEGFCTMGELMQAVDANFEGYEVLRAKLKRAPKFGNDIDFVDLIAADIVEHFTGWIESFRQEYGFHVWPDLLGWRFVQEAYGAWATPDGRCWKDPIAEHYCATPGCNTQGPTALICSVGKANLGKAYGVAAVHVSLPRILSLTEDEYVLHLEALVLAAISKGFVMINLAIYDEMQLRDAQIHPERHEDLIVRVWGYSARFIDLGPEMQEHIIRRISSS